ncbi:MAG: phage integrase N-terminal SAM-like domain-containing protein [Candidatus Thiodiazotropha sp. (ex Epidulcina cf. delphinae)]|nr:phage integrase N-terminal SAM-like domain-containing protein [Candidatus Thiodiazotropha sp. (ex Epidulcina cf. delphinae)]
MDALRLLFCHLLKTPWAGSFDWDYWSAGAQVLGNDHPTVACSYEVIDQTVKNAKNLLGTQFPDLYRKCLVAIRIPDYSINTEKRYLGWINRFLRFHRDRPPSDCSEPDVASFLEHLVIQRKVAGATQSQALNALVFFFSRVLERPLGEIGPFKRPKKPKRLNVTY